MTDPLANIPTAAVSPPKTQSSNSRVDRPALGAALEVLDAAPSFIDAHEALRGVAAAIGMPFLAWAPDVSRPDFDPDVDAFYRRERWSEDLIAAWWSRTVMLRSPLYIRCRTGSMPFVSRTADKIPERPLEMRMVRAAILATGAASLITVPIHLPRGQVAMVTFGGPRSKPEARQVLAEARPELVATGYLFMRAFEADAPAVFQPSKEERSPLTLREWECMRFTAQGLAKHEVASVLGLSATTVRYHLDNVTRKLGASNRIHAVALAAQLGLIGPIG